MVLLKGFIVPVRYTISDSLRNPELEILFCSKKMAGQKIKGPPRTFIQRAI